MIFYFLFFGIILAISWFTFLTCSRSQLMTIVRIIYTTFTNCVYIVKSIRPISNSRLQSASRQINCIPHYGNFLSFTSLDYGHIGIVHPICWNHVDVRLCFLAFINKKLLNGIVQFWIILWDYTTFLFSIFVETTYSTCFRNG